MLGSLPGYREEGVTPEVWALEAVAFEHDLIPQLPTSWLDRFSLLIISGPDGNILSSLTISTATKTETMRSEPGGQT